MGQASDSIRAPSRFQAGSVMEPSRLQPPGTASVTATGGSPSTLSVDHKWAFGIDDGNLGLEAHEAKHAFDGAE